MILDYKIYQDVELMLLRNFFDSETPLSCQQMSTDIVRLFDENYEMKKR